MNIVSIESNSDHHDYLLKEDDKTVLKLRYKNDVHIARVETDKERRVLTIEDEGLLKTKLILKNEYGIPIGSLIYDNFSATHGVVDIENTKYRFDVRKTDSTELHIYKGSRKILIYTCKLLIEENSLKDIRAAIASLIISVSWYLFLQGVSKDHHAFNEAIIL